MEKRLTHGHSPKNQNNWGKIITPVNFDINEHLRNYPTFESFEVRKMLYIMSLIYMIPTWDNDDITEDGFVPVSAEKLNGRIRGYKKYLDYLLDTGVFITNGSYVVGEKCKGFKYSELYDNSDLSSIRSWILRQGTSCQATGKVGFGNCLF